MAKFSIGELVKIKSGLMAGEPCIISSYEGIGRNSGEQLYRVRLYGGRDIYIPFNESNLERDV